MIGRPALLSSAASRLCVILSTNRTQSRQDAEENFPTKKLFQCLQQPPASKPQAPLFLNMIHATILAAQKVSGGYY